MKQGEGQIQVSPKKKKAKQQPANQTTTAETKSEKPEKANAEVKDAKQPQKTKQELEQFGLWF